LSFANPHYLIALAAVPLLAVLALLVAAKKSRVISGMGEPALLALLREGYSPDRRVIKTAIVLGALSFAVIAAARPQSGWRLVQGATKGVDLVVAVDVSASMLAEDVKPSRLERAKAELITLLEGLRGDRVAIVAFAGSAAPMCPLTADGRAASMFLDALDWGVVSEPGTDLGEAVDRAVRSFDSAPDRSKAIVLVTDGENHEGSIEAAAESAVEADVPIFCVGVGGEAGEPIPLSSVGGGRGFRRDSRGEVVLTRLDPVALRDLASATGGVLHLIRPSGGDLRGLSEDLIELPRVERPEEYSGKSERFHIAAALALSLLALGWIVGDRRGTPRRAGPLAALALLFVLSSASAEASEAKKGAALYEKGDYLGALAKFREALGEGGSAPLHYDTGNALYKLEKYGEAARRYEGSLAGADSSLSSFARYNMGNSLYQMGDLRGAVEQYVEALKLNPEDADAKHNLELALRQLGRQSRSSSADSSSSEEGGEESEPKEGDQPRDGDRRGERDQQGEDKERESPATDGEPEPRTLNEGEGEERGSFTKEEAERLLEALGAEEKDQLKKRMKAKVRRKAVEKDW
jgi:Ca-activated chloride channel family protein